MLGITASRFRSDSFRQFASPWACHMAIWSYTSRGASLTSSRRPRCSPSQAANSVWDISVSFSLSLALSLPLSIASASVHICSLGASPWERQLHLPSSPPHSICGSSFSLSQVIQCNQVAIMKRPEDVAGTGYVTSTQWWVEWCQVKAKAGRTHISLNY